MWLVKINNEMYIFFKSFSSKDMVVRKEGGPDQTIVRLRIE